MSWFCRNTVLKTLWVQRSLHLSKIGQNGTARNTNAAFSEWNAFAKGTALGSLGTPGRFQITLSAFDKGSGHYIQHGIIRDCRKQITLSYCHKVNNRRKGRDKNLSWFRTQLLI